MGHTINTTTHCTLLVVCNVEQPLILVIPRNHAFQCPRRAELGKCTSIAPIRTRDPRGGARWSASATGCGDSVQTTAKGRRRSRRCRTSSATSVPRGVCSMQEQENQGKCRRQVPVFFYQTYSLPVRLEASQMYCLRNCWDRLQPGRPPQTASDTAGPQHTDGTAPGAVRGSAQVSYSRL